MFQMYIVFIFQFWKRKIQRNSQKGVFWEDLEWTMLKDHRLLFLHQLLKTLIYFAYLPLSEILTNKFNKWHLSPEKILESNRSSKHIIIQWLTISFALMNSKGGLWVIRSLILRQNMISLRESNLLPNIHVPPFTNKNHIYKYSQCWWFQYSFLHWWITKLMQVHVMNSELLHGFIMFITK